MVAKKRVKHLGTRKDIVGLCKTRWSERDKAYEHFYLALPFLAECFEIINGAHPTLEEFDDEYNQRMGPRLKSKSNNSSQFSNKIWVYSRFGFFVLFAQGLQGKSVDIVKAYQHINKTVSNLKAVRHDTDIQFHKIYLQAERLAEKLSVIPSLPRITHRQKNRPNQPAANPEEYC